MRVETPRRTSPMTSKTEVLKLRLLSPAQAASQPPTAAQPVAGHPFDTVLVSGVPKWKPLEALIKGNKWVNLSEVAAREEAHRQAIEDHLSTYEGPGAGFIS